MPRDASPNASPGPTDCLLEDVFYNRHGTRLSRREEQVVDDGVLDGPIDAMKVKAADPAL
jgi:hypothetical protein